LKTKVPNDISTLIT